MKTLEDADDENIEDLRDRVQELGDYNHKLGQEAHCLRTTVHQLARELTESNNMIAALTEELASRDDAKVAKNA